MSTRRNIVANVAGRLWGVLSFYLFIPIYLRLLGPEAYGVVGFYTVLVGIFVIADLGLTSTMSREMARLGARPETAGERGDLAHTLELVYGGIALVIGLGLLIAAPAVASHWLQARTIPVSDLTLALRLMGVALALQLPASFYFGGLLGMERLVTANVLQIGWGILRSGGAALVLWRVEPSLRAFFWTAVIANLLYLVASRIVCWRAIAPAARPRFRTDMLQRVRRYSAGMAVLAILTTVLSQLDKLVVSRLLPLETFAHYSLAATLAQVPVIVGAAIAAPVFPRLTALTTAESFDHTRRIYHAACQLVSVVTLPLGLTLALFPDQVLAFWTRSPDTAATVGPAAMLLLLGSCALALQLVPFQLALAFGWVGLNLRIAAVSLVLMVPALAWLVPHYGVAGAAAAWLGLNVATLPVMMAGLHARVLPGALRPWVTTDVLRPLVATVMVLALARLAVPMSAPSVRGFLIAVAAGGVALVASALAAPVTRQWWSSHRPAMKAS